jgi:lysozyme
MRTGAKPVKRDLIGAPTTTSPCARPAPTKLAISSTSPQSDSLPPAVDLELAGNCSARPTRAEVNDQLGEFIGLVEEAWGREVILYVGDDFERAYPVLHELDRPLWLRRFLLRPDLDGWLIWQLHGYARVDGIDGGVDLDVMRA